MKILVPVDESDRYRHVITFIKRLGIPDVNMRLYHAVKPINCYDDSITSYAAICYTDPTAADHEEAATRLTAATACGKAEGFEASSAIALGYPSTLIQAAAAEFKADLVAIAANHRGALDRLVSGSVSLDLVEHLDRDLLIVRSEESPSGKCSLVYATNYEEGSEKCFERLLGWGMKEIAHLETLHAYASVGNPTEIETRTRKTIQEKTDLVTKRFSQSGIPSHGRSLEGPVRDAIRQTMQETGSDLLVLAAHEHGAWRDLLRSTAVYETKVESFSLLVMRESEQGRSRKVRGVEML